MKSIPFFKTLFHFLSFIDASGILFSLQKSLATSKTRTMKRQLLILLSFMFSSAAFAQEVPKNILIEHFTNTYCSVCANKNPTFYNTIAPYNKVVHVAFHPSSPYAACPLSQHNMSENDDRTNFYNLYGGTPRIVVNGNVVPSASNLISNVLLDSQNNLTSPFSISIQQFQQGPDSMYSVVTINTVAATSVTSANVIILLAEETLNLNAQNGENVHHDVFRKFLNNTNEPLAANGASVSFTFGSKIDQDWSPSQLITTVILQAANKDALQTEQSNKLDFSTGISLTKIIDEVMYPNPAKDFLYIDNKEQLIEKIEIYSIIGSLVKRIDLDHRAKVKISVSDFQEGSYIVRIYDLNNKIYTRKIVVDF